MSERRTRAATILLLLSALSLPFATLGCSALDQAASGDTSGESTTETSHVVQVERGSITSVVVLTGTVQATPSFLLAAPESGAVSFVEKPGQEPDSLVATVRDTAVSLGQAGMVSQQLVAEGQQVDAGVPIVQARYAGFGVPVEVPAEQAFRMYKKPLRAKVNITAGPSGIECTLVPALSAESAEALENGGSDDAGAEVPTVGAVCLLPLGTKAVAGLSAQLGLRTASANDVLVLPLSAVSGSTEQGEVWRVTDRAAVGEADSGTEDQSNAEVVSVRLGITDGVNIEIISGLEAHDTVRARPPGIAR